jgi:hypothetical protein
VQILNIPPAAECACPPGSEPLQSARFAYGGGPLPTDETYTLETSYNTVVVAPYALASLVVFDALLPLDA